MKERNGQRKNEDELVWSEKKYGDGMKKVVEGKEKCCKTMGRKEGKKERRKEGKKEGSKEWEK